jgi:hypothetical protein
MEFRHPSDLKSYLNPNMSLVEMSVSFVLPLDENITRSRKQFTCFVEKPYTQIQKKINYLKLLDC